MTMAVTTAGAYNMVVQGVIIALLGFAVYQMRYRQNYRIHGYVLTLAVILNLLSIILVMYPGLSRLGPTSTSPADWHYTFALVHHVVGLLAIGVSILTVGAWLLYGRTKESCPGRPENKKPFMRAVLALWSLSIILGTVLFLSLL